MLKNLMILRNKLLLIVWISMISGCVGPSEMVQINEAGISPGALISRIEIGSNQEGGTEFVISDRGTIEKIEYLFWKSGWTPSDGIEIERGIQSYRVKVLSEDGSLKVFYLTSYARDTNPLSAIQSGWWLAASNEEGKSDTSLIKRLASSAHLLDVMTLLDPVHNKTDRGNG